MIRHKAELILEVCKTIPCERMMLNQLVDEINKNMSRGREMSPKTVAFLVSALGKQNKLIVKKEVICRHRYYMVKPVETIENEIEVNGG